MTLVWLRRAERSLEAIAEIQEETPGFINNVIRGLWDRALRKAHREAENEMTMALPPPPLTWEEVFEMEYDVAP